MTSLSLRSTPRLLASTLACCALVALAIPAEASGVAIHEQGARGLGNAYAGGAAVADDASTVWWNPAGMTRLRRRSFALAAAAVFAEGTYNDLGPSRDAAGLPLRGASIVDGGQDAVIPSLFFVTPVGCRARLGLSVAAPFGLSTDYGEDWVGRYHATESALEVFDIGLSGAVKMGALSVGAGINVQYANVKALHSAVDFGAIAAANGVPGAMPQAADGLAEIEGDSWEIGFNVGLLYEMNRCTRVGLTWRSGFDHGLEGTGDFTVPAALAPVFAASGLFADTDATADLKLPQTIALSVYHQVNRRWAIMADVRWTEWSVLESVTVDFANPVQPSSVLDLQWQDTWRYSFGVTYQPCCRWTLRGGVAYDEAAVPDSTRTPRVPGNDRIWLSAGVGYKVNRVWTADLGYTYLLVDDAPINLANPRIGTLVGETKSNVHLVGFQLSATF